MATQPTAKPNAHYFGSTGLNWAKGNTRAEVLAKLAADIGPAMLKDAVKHGGGLYAWTCEIAAPFGTPYGIENFAPHGIEWHDSQEFWLMNAKGHVIPLR